MKNAGRPIGSRTIVPALILSIAFWQPLSPGSQAAGPALSGQEALGAGKAKLAAGQYQAALAYFRQALKRQPGSCEAHLCLGEAYLKLKDPFQARHHLRTALRVGHGSPAAQEANTRLLTLPESLIAPGSGGAAPVIASKLGLVSPDSGLGVERKPTVVDFYASWCKPCQELRLLIEKARADYGHKVNFLSVDVDDPKSDELVDLYDVSPIPTIVFLNANGQVITYSIGFAGEKALHDGLEKLLKG